MSGSNRIRNIIQELENINSGNINLNYYENYYNYSTNENTSENIDTPIDNAQRSIPENRNESTSNIDQYSANMNSNLNNIQDENIADITVNLYSPSNLDNTSSSTQGNNLNQSNPNSTPINISANTNRTNIPPINNLSGTNANIPENILNGISSILGDIGPLSDALSVGASIYRVDNIYNTPATNTQQDHLTLAQLNEKTTVYIQDTALPADKCPICNELYTDDCVYRKNIACGHYFHQGCIDTWYSENYKCPVCNQDIR